MILVTGGAGSIGANFVLDWLREVGEPVVKLDKLTYAATATGWCDSMDADLLLFGGNPYRHSSESAS